MANDGIKTFYQALSQYNNLQERILPWKEFNKTIIKMDKYHQNYSIESRELISEIKGLILSGKDAYLAASRHIYDWAGLVTPLLASYISLFKRSTSANAKTQKDILLQVFDDGILRLSASQDELYKSSTSFNTAAGKLVALHGRFEFEFQAESDFIQSKITNTRLGAYLGGAFFGIPGILIGYLFAENMLIPVLTKRLKAIEHFYDKLEGKIDQAAKDIDNAKRTLANEIQHIGEIKIKTKEANAFINLDQEDTLKNMAIKSAHQLIKECEEYREKHIKKVEKKEKKVTKSKRSRKSRKSRHGK